VEKIAPILIEDGRYVHPWIGITARSLDLYLREAMDLPRDQQGILVVEVTEGSPADDAGLRPSEGNAEVLNQEIATGGDIILAIDGETTDQFEDLISFLARKAEVGQEITLDVLRGDERVEVQLTLAARPEQQEE